MSNPIHIVLLLALIAFYILPAVLAGRIADRKGRSFAVYLVASLLIGWPIPLLIALVVPNRAARRQLA
jgi:MFS family permease